MKLPDTTSPTAGTADQAASGEFPSAETRNKAQGVNSSMNPNQNSSPNAGLSPAVQKHIGNLLKVSYQDLLTEPVPDRFANLLEQLEQAEKKGK